MDARFRAVLAALLCFSLVLQVPSPIAEAAAPAAAPIPVPVHQLMDANRYLPALQRPTPPSQAIFAANQHQLVLATRIVAGRKVAGPAVSAIVPDVRRAPPDPRAMRVMSSPTMVRSLRGSGRAGGRAVATPAPGINCLACQTPTPAPRTPAPTVKPTSSPTPIPTATPTPVPTATPTPSGQCSTTSSPYAMVNPGSGTGINHWWTYEQGSLPGVGHYYVNVANQNLVLQATDLAVPNAGVPMTFERTYNLQSRHDAAGSDGAVPSILGNGWTTTFDTHIALNNAGGMTVFDGDGSQYDYTPDGQGHWVAPAGLHAQLVTYDGGSYYWFKNDGTVDVFYSPAYTGPYAGWNGRLISINGRNRNNSLQVTYAWQCGNAANWSNVAEMDVTSQAGLTTRFYFTQANGFSLVSLMVAPDGVTTTQYYYDSSGNLAQVVHPGSDVSSGRFES
jgi:hypothetical protein